MQTLALTGAYCSGAQKCVKYSVGRRQDTSLFTVIQIARISHDSSNLLENNWVSFILMVLLLPDLRDMEVGELAWVLWMTNDVLCQDLPHSPWLRCYRTKYYARPIPSFKVTSRKLLNSSLEINISRAQSTCLPCRLRQGSLSVVFSVYTSIELLEAQVSYNQARRKNREEDSLLLQLLLC